MARTRSWRRAQRRRIVARRLAFARAYWSDLASLPDEPARWAKYNPFVCCSFCQWDPAYPARWRWSHQLDAERELVLQPEQTRGGMGRR